MPACYGREAGFTVVVLPDTQNYSDDNPDTYFKAQTQWIVDNKDDLEHRLCCTCRGYRQHRDRHRSMDARRCCHGFVGCGEHSLWSSPWQP